jgi:hypothetical protein
MLTPVDIQRAIAPLREKVVRVPGAEAKPSSHDLKNNLFKEPAEIVEHGFLASLLAFDPEEEQQEGRKAKKHRKGGPAKSVAAGSGGAKAPSPGRAGDKPFQAKPSALQEEEKGHLIDLSV